MINSLAHFTARRAIRDDALFGAKHLFTKPSDPTVWAVGCRACHRPLFTWETDGGLCRNCAISDVQPGQVVRRADNSLFVLAPRPLDRFKALMLSQSPQTRVRMAERFEVHRTDGTIETVYQ